MRWKPGREEKRLPILHNPAAREDGNSKNTTPLILYPPSLSDPITRLLACREALAGVSSRLFAVMARETPIMVIFPNRFLTEITTLTNFVPSS